MVAYGYDTVEVGLPYKPLKRDVKFYLYKNGSERKPVMASLGCHVKGFAPLHPNPWGLSTTLLGVAARVAREIPKPQKENLTEFFCFVKETLIPQMFPHRLPSDFDWSHKSWLRDRPYPAWRKAELARVQEQTCNRFDLKKHTVNKCFMKDETYMARKHSRGIYSKHDAFKNRAGPLASGSESIVFNHPAFIKHVPVLERPGLLYDTLYQPGAKYVVSDYTAYESHFTAEVMHNVEFELYRYLWRDVPGALEELEFCEKVICGRQECYFKNFRFAVNASRMSGEMFTSIGNGFTNYALMAFAAHKLGTTLKGFVEGDDGLFVFGNNIIPDSKFFEDLGFTIKMETHDQLNKASFCGNLFDEEDLIVVTDPIEVLANFGWSKTPYVNSTQTRLKELLKSKSLSFAYQYRGCPIIQSLAHYGLRMTKHIDLRRYIEKDRSLSLWEREQLLEALAHRNEIERVEVPIRTRLLVQELYGVTLDEQRQIEEYLDGLETLQPLYLPIFEHLFPQDCAVYYTYYVDEGLGTFCGNLKRDDSWIDVYKRHLIVTPGFSKLGYPAGHYT